MGALLLPCSAGPLAAQDVEAALARAEQAYHRLTTLTANFTQTLVNPMLGEPEETRGRLFLTPPDRFAMRWTDPSGERIVADGEWLWAYAPSSVPDQVIRQAVPQSGPSSPQLFGQFVDRPLERYTAQHVGEETTDGVAVDIVLLTPRHADMPFRRAVIAVARSDGLLRRISVTEESGQRRVLVFSGIRTNVPIPEAELRFDVPRGTRIVTP